MAKGIKKNGRSTYPDGKFITLYEWLMKSEAWQSLDVFARCVYIELRRRYNGLNNGAITVSTRELCKALKCTHKPVTRALRQLQDRGFIVSIQRGSFNWKTRIDDTEKHRASIWLLTELPQDEPEKSLVATRDFKKWKAEKNTLEEKNAVGLKPSYGDTTATINNNMVLPEPPMVLPEPPFSANSSDEWRLKDHTYNIPYTPSKNNTDGGDGHE